MPSRPTEPLEGLTHRTGRFEDRCDLGPLLGKGGVGAVRGGHQRHLARQVAVKTVDGSEQMLHQEAAAMAAVAGPGVPSVFGMGRDDFDRPALYMSRVEGRSWRSLICPGGRLLAPPGAAADPLDWHLGVLLDVAAVVERAHARGVIHRDIKPGNVLARADGTASLIDWGLALAVDERNPALRHVDDVEQVEGTTGYLAPEMIAVRSRLIGLRTDVFLLGACLHMLLTGRAPYVQPDMTARLKAALKCLPEDYPSTAPAGLVAIARRAMSRRPGERYPDAGAFRAALAACRATRRARRHVASARAAMNCLERMWHEGGDADVEALLAPVRRHLVTALHLEPDNRDAMALLLRSGRLQDSIASRSLCTRAVSAPTAPRPRGGAVPAITRVG